MCGICSHPLIKCKAESFSVWDGEESQLRNRDDLDAIDRGTRVGIGGCSRRGRQCEPRGSDTNAAELHVVATRVVGLDERSVKIRVRRIGQTDAGRGDP